MYRKRIWGRVKYTHAVKRISEMKPSVHFYSVSYRYPHFISTLEIFHCKNDLFFHFIASYFRTHVTFQHDAATFCACVKHRRWLVLFPSLFFCSIRKFSQRNNSKWESFEPIHLSTVGCSVHVFHSLFFNLQLSIAWYNLCPRCLKWMCAAIYVCGCVCVWRSIFKFSNCF